MLLAYIIGSEHYSNDISGIFYVFRVFIVM